MKCSVVVAAYNEEEHIRQCLQSLMKQEQKASEIILVDNGSNDKTIEIASKFKVKIIKAGHVGRSAGRNIGWKNAVQKIVCFAEADAVFDKNWLKEILKKFESGANAVIDRRKLFKPKTFAQKTFNANFDIRYSGYVPFSAWAFKKSVLEKVNGFDENLYYGEDQDLGIRIKREGFKIFLAENAVQYHKGEPKNFFEFAKRAFVFGREKSKLFHKKYPKTVPIKKMFFLFTLISLLTLSFFNVLFFYALVFSAGLSCLAALFKTAFVEKGLGKVEIQYVFSVAFLKLLYSTFYSLGVFSSYFFTK